MASEDFYYLVHLIQITLGLGLGLGFDSFWNSSLFYLKNIYIYIWNTLMNYFRVLHTVKPRYTELAVQEQKFGI